MNHLSPPNRKIALFRSLFRGRSDVYPRRFDNLRSGKSGYAPACGNEWVRGVCEKPRIRCSDCPSQHWLPLTDEVVHWHLAGEDSAGKPFLMGLYPMLLDETCFFLAADFDGPEWRDDVLAFLSTCREHDIPAALERSRSGDGAHLWIFFENATPAALARKLGTHLLTETLDKRPGIGLASYDRFFPNQDTLPRGGFGNLIALPLQKRPREQGHSVFLNDALEPHPDQWAFLASIKKVPLARVDTIVQDATRLHRVLPVRVAPDEEFRLAPWQATPSRRAMPRAIPGPLPPSLELTLGNLIYIPKEELPPALRNRLLHLAAFQNPEFYRAQAMRLSTHDKPRIIACAEDYPAHIGLPRGCLEDILELLQDLKIPVTTREERQHGTPLNLTFQGTLRPDQEAAAKAMLAHDTGVLAATTAFGKTVLAAWLIAARGVNTLILVHRRQLLEQWSARLKTFLNLPEDSLGRIGGGLRKPTGKIDVALIQSLVRKGAVQNLVADYGHLVVDECHHIPASGFELVARRAKARFVTGLSATVDRKDGHHPILFMQCGPVRHRVDARHQALDRPFRHHIIVRPTNIRQLRDPETDPRIEFHNLCETLIHDKSRNTLLIEDVSHVLAEGRSPLVLTERTNHLEILRKFLVPTGAEIIELRGGLTKSATQSAMARLADIPVGQPRILLATGRYIGEGFDDPRLDTLFLALPISWRGTVTQYVGRLHRLHDGKREVRVYDYADLNIPMLERMFNKRCATYESVGYTILLPASALPGWPAEVSLPVDPEWKRDYSASVRRLILDGVQKPLARLFLEASAKPTPGVQGIERARSAAEAFLFERLENLKSTSGKFQLNAELPIPFAQQGTMEIDFLCPEAHLAIELDGPQHLADEDAWRRDRRKDALLQQHGYLILRFLTTDTAKNLGQVLDQIQSMLLSRTLKNSL